MHKDRTNKDLFFHHSSIKKISTTSSDEGNNDSDHDEYEKHLSLLLDRKMKEVEREFKQEKLDVNTVSPTKKAVSQLSSSDDVYIISFNSYHYIS